ncbi:hypothetical protein MJ581_18935 [Escherichia coli]|nr:hypothetical protein MJ581_18935 [Escherichia coli]
MKAGHPCLGYVGRAVRDCRRVTGGDTLIKNDVYFMVGLLTTIGLSAKNAIFDC